jgi:L-ascorbate metabolism protein UlaG (beta-lactamase superfamily)
MSPKKVSISSGPAALLCIALCACGSREPAVSEPSPEKQKAPVADPETEGVYVLDTSMGPVRITPIWHGTLSLEIGETTIVIDPWSKAPAGRLPKAELILITDIHPDHLDKAAIEQVRRTESIILAPQAALETLPNAEPINNGETATKLGIGIEAIPMYNLKRGPEEGKLFHDKGRGNGYVLSFGETRVYISGDTECTPEMRALEDIDLAFVCMNLPYTMPPKEAAECIRAFRPKVAIPFHYRGSNLDELEIGLHGEPGIDLRFYDFYAE